MPHRLLYIRQPTNAECQFKSEKLSDEDNYIVSVMGPSGLRLKYQLKEDERQKKEREFKKLLLKLCK